MASISKLQNGRKAIQFVDSDGRRQTIRLGKISKRAAESIKVKVESLISSKKNGTPIEGDVLTWLDKIEDVLRARLEKFELIESKRVDGLQSFVESYIVDRTDVKPSTTTVYRRAQRHLASFFDDEVTLSDVSVADAKRFQRYLKSEQKLADDTVRRTCGIAKQFFAEALDRGLIDSNPFKSREIPTSTGSGDAKRQFFINRNFAYEVIENLPTNQWKLMFALARFGGLRCPSEVLSLRWSDIDSANKRIRVSSPKTEHHPGQDQRIIPLFPELTPFIDACKSSSNDSNGYVITNYRRFDSNYGTLLRKKIEQMGMDPWPKPWQNLRASRETELVEEFPLHVVCSWIGNSEVVARKHYLQVTNEHFEKALQNPVQQMSETGGNGSQTENQETKKSLVLPGISENCDSVQVFIVGDTGLEPVTPCL